MNAFSNGVLVIGGGPAGAATAIRLRRHGVPVELVERSVFPRFKVCGCCLGGAGLRALEEIECGRWVEANGVPLDRWRGVFDGRGVSVPLRGGVAISRERLDEQLLREAARVGVLIRQPCSAAIVAAEPGGVTVSLAADGRVATQGYGLVVVAAGLNGVATPRVDGIPLLPWIESPHGPIGVAFTLEHSDGDAVAGVAAGEIRMACDGRGYVGTVRLEDGRVDVAAAVHGFGGNGGRDRLVSEVIAIARGMAASEWGMSARERGRPTDQRGRPTDQRGGRGMNGRPPCDATGWGGKNSASTDAGPLVTGPLVTGPLVTGPLVTGPLVTGPLRRARVAGRGRVLAVGDAAGYVEPFTGEGITWALQTGIAAADQVATDGGPQASIGDRWRDRYHELMRRPRARCGGLTRAIRSGGVRRAVSVAIGHAPWLARPILRTLE